MRFEHHSGFSLVELMVAMAISSAVIVAAATTYASTRQTNRLQSMQSRLSEDGRFALSMLQRVYAQAGFRINPVGNLPADRFEANVNTSTVRFETDGSNQIVCNGSVPASSTTRQVITIAQAGSRLRCDTVDWIAPGAANVGNGTELVDFRIQLGIDNAAPPGTGADVSCNPPATSRDCIVDTYVNALTDTTPASTADQIVAVKVCLVLRTEAMDASVIKEAAVNDCVGAAVANSQEDHKLYRMFRSTVLLKNR